MSDTLDKIRGIIMGVCLGDALGAPHEPRGSNVPYTGLLQHETHWPTRFQGVKMLSVGALTDDSEMMLVIARSLIKCGHYNRDDVIKGYIAWANQPGNWTIGKNTRIMFKGISTVKGFDGRLDKMLQQPMSERTQSDGTLMRCAPLAVLALNSNAYYEDCILTNPCVVNIEASYVYMMVLKSILAYGYTAPADYLIDTCLQLVTEQVLIDAINDARSNMKRVIHGKDKGWVVHSLWCALHGMYHFRNPESSYNYQTFQDVVDSIILLGGDTDTNAAITGAVIGAMVGYNEMRTSDERTHYNTNLLRTNDVTQGHTPKRVIDGISDFDSLCDGLAALYVAE